MNISILSFERDNHRNGYSITVIGTGDIFCHCMQATPQSSFLRRILVQLVNKLPVFMETDDALPCSQNPHEEARNNQLVEATKITRISRTTVKQEVATASVSRLHKMDMKKAKSVPLYAMETLGEERMYSSYSFLTWALDGGVISVTTRPQLNPLERTPGTRWVGPGVETRLSSAYRSHCIG
jgi:hypothetical protein